MRNHTHLERTLMLAIGDIQRHLRETAGFAPMAGCDLIDDANAIVKEDLADAGIDMEPAYARLRNMVDRAKIVDSLPKTADGVPIHPGMIVYKVSGIAMEVRGCRPIDDDETAVMIYGRGAEYLKTLLSELFSTKEAADAAGPL